MRSWSGGLPAVSLALCLSVVVNCKSAPAKPVEPPPALTVVETPPPEPVARAMPEAGPMEVAVISELALRVAPGRKSNFIRAIPYGATVQVLDRFGPDDIARSVEGKWYKVSYRGKTGWVFGGFLREVGEEHRYRLKGRRAIRVE